MTREKKVGENDSKRPGVGFARHSRAQQISNRRFKHHHKGKKKKSKKKKSPLTQNPSTC